MVDPKDALPGRATPMTVSEKHFVLGTPMRGPWPAEMKTCIFANGCFWGSEKGVWRLPGGGIHTTAVGYACGFSPNPTYQEACSGQSGHTEAVQVIFNPEKTSYVDILRWFWESHDPTQGMGQGNDRGTQYRSALCYFDDEQKQLCEASAKAYQEALRVAGKGNGDRGGNPKYTVTTEICSASDITAKGIEPFYYGEDHHQQYLAKPGARPYCSAQPQQVSLPPFKDWCPPGLEHHAPKLDDNFWAKHAPAPHSVIRSTNEVIKCECGQVGA